MAWRDPERSKPSARRDDLQLNKDRNAPNSSEESVFAKRVSDTEGQRRFAVECNLAESRQQVVRSEIQRAAGDMCAQFGGTGGDCAPPAEAMGNVLVASVARRRPITVIGATNASLRPREARIRPRARR